MDARRSRSHRPDDRPSGRSRAWFVPRSLHRFLEQSVEMRPISLRFVDPSIESEFRSSCFRESLPYVRLAHVMGIIVIGMAAGYGLERATRLVFLRERQLDRARRRAEPTYRLLIGRFEFSEPCTVELKGKGPTQARFLLGRAGDRA